MMKAGVIFFSLATLSFLGLGLPVSHFIRSIKLPSARQKRTVSAKSFSPASADNHPPVVKITTPKNNGVYDWDIPVPYTISVSDAEDGESQYGEIAGDEVILEVKYVPDASKAATQPTSVAGIAVIKSSNCFNCHAVSSKLIGPSFSDISKRYSYTNANIQSLAKHIRDGSTGVWGNVSMPSHPELTGAQTSSIAQWILKNGTQPGLNYYRGVEGSFRLKAPANSKQKGAYVLTASYTDHGVKEGLEKRLTGQNVVVIRGK